MPSQILLKLLKIFGHQDWISIVIRDRIIRYFINPHTINSFEFETNYLGLKFKGNLNSVIDFYIYFMEFEKGILFLMRDLLKEKPGCVFIDIGANVGVHSLFMSNFCSQVHSFEPYQKVRERLIHNMQLNQINNIIVHDIGLGSKDEYLDFFVPIGAHQGEGSFLSEHRGDSKLIGKLKVVNGDSYISRLQLNNIGLIKIDVEGFEKDVLIGLENSLKVYRPFIVMEYSTTTKSKMSLKELKEILPAGSIMKEINIDRKFCMFFNRMNYQLFDINFNKQAGINLLLLPAIK